MKQVEIFSRSDAVKLQTQINDFLKEVEQDGGEVIDIKFAASETGEREAVFCALVIYNCAS